MVVRKDIILVICDKISKRTHFITITKGISVEELARLFQDNVWKLYGLLDIKQKTTVCSKIDKEIKQNVGNWDKTVNSLSSTNCQVYKQ